METQMRNAVERIYPGAKIEGANQVLVDGEGWIDYDVRDGAAVLELCRRGTDAWGRTVRMLALTLDDGGVQRIADFRPEEVL